MAREQPSGYLIRRRRRNRKGKPYAEAKWTAVWFDLDGRKHQEAAYASKAKSSLVLARRLRQAAAGVRDFGDPYAEHRTTALDEHARDFLTSLAAGGAGEGYLAHVATYLATTWAALGAKLPGDVTTTKLERFLLRLVRQGVPRLAGTRTGKASPVSYRTRNHYLAAISEFFRWGVARGRWPTNPAAPIRLLKPEADAGYADRRRRALTADELAAVVAAARTRPRENYHATHPGATAAKLAALDILGEQRATVYTVAALQGLRRAECRAVRWGDLLLDGPQPTLTVRAAVAKARREDILPLASAAARALRAWRATWTRKHGRGPADDDLVFDCLTHGAVKALRADLRAADVPVRTADGQVDFHSLRHTTATLLSRAGVPVRTAQELLRHRDPRTTMRVYAHCYPADKLDAIRRLPKLDSDDPEVRPRAAGGTR